MSSKVNKTKQHSTSEVGAWCKIQTICSAMLVDLMGKVHFRYIFMESAFIKNHCSTGSQKGKNSTLWRDVSFLRISVCHIA